MKEKSFKILAFFTVPSTFLLGILAAIITRSNPDTALIDQSDHFNGKKFFNPTMDSEYAPGFSDVFRMAKEGRPKWPAHIENKPQPKPASSIEPGELSVTFVNHATFLIQLPGLNILTDPVWSERIGPFSWLGIKRIRDPGIRIEDLPRIDVILISHNHYDHLDVKTLKTLNNMFSPLVLVPLGDKSRVESIGFAKVRQMDWWESVDTGSLTKITFTPTQHSSRRNLFDLDQSLWGSFYIQNDKHSVYFGGDAAYSTHYKDIRERLGPPDVALLTIGDYLPRWFMQPIHMSPSESVAAHIDLGAQQSIAMHFRTFQNSSVSFGQELADLQHALDEEALPKNSFIALDEGETKQYK